MRNYQEEAISALRQLHNESHEVPTARLLETKPTARRWSGGWQPPGELAGGLGTAAPQGNAQANDDNLRNTQT